jgi:hypothetical protein
MEFEKDNIGKVILVKKGFVLIVGYDFLHKHYIGLYSKNLAPKYIKIPYSDIKLAYDYRDILSKVSYSRLKTVSLKNN